MKKPAKLRKPEGQPLSAEPQKVRVTRDEWKAAYFKLRHHVRYSAKPHSSKGVILLAADLEPIISLIAALDFHPAQEILVWCE